MPDRIQELLAVRVPAQPRPVHDSAPSVAASFPSEDLVIGCGVAIFHVASARVVLCYHTRKHYWFLPKGRREAGEGCTHAAEREGFEESGYRNRLLPVPILRDQIPRAGAGAGAAAPHRHRPAPRRPSALPRRRRHTATRPTHPRSTPTHSSYNYSSPSNRSSPPHHHPFSPFATHPIYTVSEPAGTPNHILLFYVAETLPPALDTTNPDPPTRTPFTPAPRAPPPPPPPRSQSNHNPATANHADAATATATATATANDHPRLTHRVRHEPAGYQPPRWPGTAASAEERLYESRLVRVEEAVGLLVAGSAAGSAEGEGGKEEGSAGVVLAEVVRRGWGAVRGRLGWELAEELAGEGEDGEREGWEDDEEWEGEGEGREDEEGSEDEEPEEEVEKLEEEEEEPKEKRLNT
ncbi:nudix domain-containing protein [Diplodia corticola]|uniref:Nudix domain-containing protein n=1 Tax=Diplodia corticola TaxID=236234 RepID=A0A1J9RX93_9PEZI|nr:nudix domain-containing protein [Diplodia corticola]OJD32101.1 nudix domain-containing protein [Diplodia corticola]